MRWPGPARPTDIVGRDICWCWFHAVAWTRVVGATLATRLSDEWRLRVIHVVSPMSTMSPVYPRQRTYCGIAANRRDGPFPDSCAAATALYPFACDGEIGREPGCGGSRALCDHACRAIGAQTGDGGLRPTLSASAGSNASFRMLSAQHQG
jgi:hypothetical protein